MVFGRVSLERPLGDGQESCHILQGKSLQATASATSLPYHTVRSLLTEVAGIIEGVRNLKENYPSLKPYLHPPRKEKCTA